MDFLKRSVHVAENRLEARLSKKGTKNSAVLRALNQPSQKKKPNVNSAKKAFQKGKQQVYFLLVILFIPLIFLSSFHLFIFNQGYYEKEFTKNNIYAVYQKEIVDNAVRDLFTYFKGEGELKTSFFNQKEREHLVDVKGLIQKARYTFYLATFFCFLFTLFLFISKQYAVMGKVLFAGGVLSTSFLILFSLSLLFFRPFFYQFHLLFFRNDLWLLNPETDNLINLFPEQFFFDIFRDILVVSFVISLVFILVGKVLLKKSEGASA